MTTLTLLILDFLTKLESDDHMIVYISSLQLKYEFVRPTSESDSDNH